MLATSLGVDWNGPGYQTKQATVWFFAAATMAIFCLSPTTGIGEERSVSALANRPDIDLSQHPVPRLAPGIVIGQAKNAGYSDLVTLVLPRLASGSIESLPEFAKTYTSMFKFTVLADVRPAVDGELQYYKLDKVGVGFAMDIKGQTTTVTQDTANNYGADLGFIARNVLAGNEDCLDEIVQVARTRQLIVFDAKANMLVDETHKQRIIRHFVWASPDGGKIGFLVWLLDETKAAQYAFASPAMQWLPGGYQEDRQIHVSAGGLLSSIPTPDRFAMVKLPPGVTVPMSEKLKSVAGNKSFTKSDLDRLLAGAAESMAPFNQPR